MGKVVTTLNLDEDVLEIAKRTFPNLSKTVNDILKEMLDLNNIEKGKLIFQLKTAEERVLEDRKKIATIHQLLNTANSISSEEIEAAEIKRIWIRCYGEARNNMNEGYKITDTTLKAAESILNLTRDQIKELVEEVVDDVYCDDLDAIEAQSWDLIKEKYLGDD